MASVQAQQHKERMGRAYAAMEVYKVPRKLLTSVLNTLLKAYDGEWDFIEAENYRVLVDGYFDIVETEKSSKAGGGGPVTRARRANSGSERADNSDDSYSPPRAPSPPPRTPPSASKPPRPNALVAVKLEPDSHGPALPETVTHGMEYHSGASVRTRAASQNSPLSIGGSPGARGRVVPHSPAAANERDKGKSPIVPESRRLQTRGGRGHPNANHLAIVSDLPAPEGIEKVAFEKVDGIIIPAVRKTPNATENGAVAPPKQADQLPPLTSRVKIEDETVDQQNNAGSEDHQQNGPGNEVLSLNPIRAADPVRERSVFTQTEPQEDIVHVQIEPKVGVVDAQIEPSANPSPGSNHRSSEDVSVDQIAESLEAIPQSSGASLEIVPYGTPISNGSSTRAKQPPNVASVESVDEDSKVELGEQGNAILPEENKNNGDPVLSLVDYEDDEPWEPTEIATPGAGCDVLIPDESSDRLETPPEHDEQEIRPNFIVSGSKRDTPDAQVAVEPKRQKCESSACPELKVKEVELKDNGDVKKQALTTAPARRRLIIPPQSSPKDPVSIEEADDCTVISSTAPPTASGVKRKLIISASPSPETAVCPKAKNNDKKKIVGDCCDDRVKPEARGGRVNTNSDLKRVKLEPGAEDPNVQQLKHDPNDISRGSERIPIPFVNEFTSETISLKFNYIPTNVVYQNAHINTSLARISDENFCSDCAGDCLRAAFPCQCTRETGGEFSYSKDGLLKPDIIQYEVDSSQDLDMKNAQLVFCPSGWHCPIERAKNLENPDKCKGHTERKFLKECWHKCGCSTLCGNRVVQRGICRKLQVFFTNNGKGWGLRTVEDLPAGAFVCEYVGEIMTNMELDERNQECKSRQTDLKDTYPVLLDGDWCSESGLKDEDALCLDATRYGNVARFINHRCFDANLIDKPVSIETMDRHYYHVAFFTCRDVQAGEELTWDYKIDFEDQDHPIDAFQCLCKSECCRGRSVTKKRK